MSNIFIYKVGDTYYRSWNNVDEYMNESMDSPIEGKLFSYNNRQYLYSNGIFDILSNTGGIKWETF
jgi:hypothetical protein